MRSWAGDVVRAPFAEVPAAVTDGALDESRVLPTVATLTGRPPRTFAQWAAEHAAAFS